MSDREIEEIFTNTVDGLQDTAFATSLSKWRVKILNCVKDVSKQAHIPSIEVLCELITKLVEVNNIYKIPLYRYNKSLYSILQEDGSLVKINALSSSKKVETNVWVMKETLLPVKKASLSSMIFREVHQFKCDFLTKYYTEKNGYKIIKREAEETSSIGSFPEVRKIIKKNPVKVISEVSCSVTDDDSPMMQIRDKTESHEISLLCRDLVNKLIGILSEPAKLVLEKIIEDPDMPVRTIKRECKLKNKREVLLAKAEIARKADRISGGGISFGLFSPVYFEGR